MTFMLRPVTAILLIFGLAGGAAAQVKVNHSPADVRQRTFNPKRPPKDMPPLKPGEAAVTESQFACQVKVEVEITQPPSGKATVRITGVDATLKLDVVI